MRECTCAIREQLIIPVIHEHQRIYGMCIMESCRSSVIFVYGNDGEGGTYVCHPDYYVSLVYGPTNIIKVNDFILALPIYYHYYVFAALSYHLSGAFVSSSSSSSLRYVKRDII